MCATACAPALRPAAPAAVPAPVAAVYAAPRETAPATARLVDAPSRDVRPAMAVAPVAVVGVAAAPSSTSVRRDTVTAANGLDVRDYQNDERVTRYVALFSGPARESFTAQLERGTRYEPMIRARLRSAGLPEELYFLALIESGYDPQATSRVAAVGMWQIMAGTARELGLRMDWWIDERRDPIRATDAAVRNLKWLRSEFGSPLLAAAAYNGGPTRLSRGLAQLAAAASARADSLRLDEARSDVAGGETVAANDSAADVDPVRAIAVVAPRPTVPADDDAIAASLAATADARFFALASAGYLRPETKNYVPQLIAALLVARDTARYGIVVHPQPAYAYDSVRVAALTPLAAVATAAGATREELLDLNPHVLRGVTPPGAPSVLRVPLGSGAEALRRLDELPESDRRAFRRVTTAKHELLADIVDREGVPLRAVRRYNPGLETVTRGKWKGRLVAGQTVRVPTRAVLAYARDLPDADAAPLAALPRLVAERGDFVPAAARESSPKAAATKAHAASGAKRRDTDRARAGSKSHAAAKPHASAKTHKAPKPRVTSGKAPNAKRRRPAS